MTLNDLQKSLDSLGLSIDQSVAERDALRMIRDDAARLCVAIDEYVARYSDNDLTPEIMRPYRALTARLAASTET